MDTALRVFASFCGPFWVRMYSVLAEELLSFVIFLTPDIQTRLNSTETELAINKAKIDQLEKENAGIGISQCSDTLNMTFRTKF